MLVVTGALGNIGRRVVEHFGPAVGVDRQTGTDITRDLASDDYDATGLTSALREARTLIHLGTSADPDAPPDIHLAATLGTTRLVHACTRADVPHLILASSNWAAPSDPALEMNAYGQSKRVVEALAAIYGAVPDRKAHALRLGWMPRNPADVAVAPDWLQRDYWPDEVLFDRIASLLPG